MSNQHHSGGVFGRLGGLRTESADRAEELGTGRLVGTPMSALSSHPSGPVGQQGRKCGMHFMLGCLLEPDSRVCGGKAGDFIPNSQSRNVLGRCVKSSDLARRNGLSAGDAFGTSRSPRA